MKDIKIQIFIAAQEDTSFGMFYELGFSSMPRPVFLEVVKWLKDYDAFFIGESKKWIIPAESWKKFTSLFDNDVKETGEFGDNLEIELML
jgi:hypothetical protein